MVEDVESFPAEFKGSLFLDREAFEKADVEVGAAGEVQGIAANGAVGQPSWNNVCAWIVVERTEDAARAEFALSAEEIA